MTELLIRPRQNRHRQTSTRLPLSPENIQLCFVCCGVEEANVASWTVARLRSYREKMEVLLLELRNKVAQKRTAGLCLMRWFIDRCFDSRSRKTPDILLRCCTMMSFSSRNRTRALVHFPGMYWCTDDYVLLYQSLHVAVMSAWCWADHSAFAMPHHCNTAVELSVRA